MSREVREVAKILADLVERAFRNNDDAAMRAFGSNTAHAIARELDIALRQTGPYGSEPQPKIVTPCPSCGGGIFIGTGGHLTCARLGCPSPGVGGAIDEIQAELRAARAAGPYNALTYETLVRIDSLAGRDEEGPTGPKPPFRWRTVALMALDLAHNALTEKP